MPFEITHRTTYRYSAPVALGEHRLMLRPFDSHDLRLLDARLSITPSAVLDWEHDVFGNSVARARFDGQTDLLEIVSTLTLERYPRVAAAPAATRVGWPPDYTAEERLDLGAMTQPIRPEDDAAVRSWLEAELGGALVQGARQRDVLDALNGLIHASLTYAARDDEGTQSAAETLALRSGSCRDYAALFIAGARSLGFGARFVSGYLYSPALDGGGAAAVGAAATHAWADVYVCGDGWIGYDPTNRLVESADLIRVATVRAPWQAAPVAGAFTGAAAATLEVDVQVSHAPGPAA